MNNNERERVLNVSINSSTAWQFSLGPKRGKMGRVNGGDGDSGGDRSDGSAYGERECIKNDRWRNDGGADADSAGPSDRSFSMHARSPARVLRRVFTSVFTWTSDACWHCSDQTGIRARSLLFPLYFSSLLYNVDSWENWSNGGKSARARARKIRIELKNSSLLIVRVYIGMRKAERLCYNYTKYPRDGYSRIEIINKS